MNPIIPLENARKVKNFRKMKKNSKHKNPCRSEDHKFKRLKSRVLSKITESQRLYILGKIINGLGPVILKKFIMKEFSQEKINLLKETK